DSRFRPLVVAWLAFEKSEDYISTRTLPTHGLRPQAISHWINTARPSHYKPSNFDVDSFADTFEKWYRAIQPDWWRIGEGTLLKTPGGDWTELRVAGKNGIMSVLMGLVIWEEGITEMPNR
ncbi:hypothetical protein K435DRAFT_596839, partial [Dendrothele bispora CBS 962.96]